MQPPTQEGDLPVAGRRGQQEESRQERFLQELLNSPLLTVPLLHAAAEPGGLNESRSELPEQSVEAAAAALAAARRFLALRARQHLGTCETSTGASSSQQPAEQQPSKRSLWPRPPRMHVSEPVLQGSPGASSSTTTTNNQAPAAVPNEGFPSEEELANAADAAADGSAATSVKILQQLEAALSKAVHLGEEALGGVSSVALESLQLTAEGLQKARPLSKKNVDYECLYQQTPDTSERANKACSTHACGGLIDVLLCFAGGSRAAPPSLIGPHFSLPQARTVTKFRQFEQFLLSSQALPVSVGLVFGPSRLDSARPDHARLRRLRSSIDPIAAHS